MSAVRASVALHADGTVSVQIGTASVRVSAADAWALASALQAAVRALPRLVSLGEATFCDPGMARDSLEVAP